MVGAGGVGCELLKTLALWLSRYSHCKSLFLLLYLCIVVSFYFFLAFCNCMAYYWFQQSRFLRFQFLFSWLPIFFVNMCLLRVVMVFSIVTNVNWILCGNRHLMEIIASLPLLRPCI